MSAAAAATADAGAPAKKGKKKLLVIIIAVVLLLVIAGGAALVLMKKKAASADDGADDAPVSQRDSDSDKPDLKHPPTFLPIDPFVVNLSDKDSDRYAQIGITFEVSDEHFAEEMKAFMPAIRNGILLILSHKTSKELLDLAGKEQLAGEILRDASRTMGIDVEEPDPVDENAADGDADKPKPKPKKKKKHRAAEPNPIKHVHFSNFIVQ
ncbi:MAG TPA: flagellar basal body-associated FliL family protein [Burkholderiaceae bacterium]|jgi:flagellar FliL protein